MIRKMFLVATLVAIPMLAPTKAQAAGEYCREYTKTISVGGRAAQGYGTACRQPDGAWEIVSLTGDDRARSQVREVIYDDLQHRYGRSRDRVVVVERSYYPRYQSAFRWPIFFNFNSHDHKHYKRSYYKKSYHHDHGKHKGHNKNHKKGRH